MCLLSSVYRLCAERQEGEHFVPTARAAQELQMLCLFAPFLGTNVRAHYATEVFASDASPFAGALGSTKVEEAVVEEFYRRRYRRGGYVKMESDIGAFLRTRPDPEEESSEAVAEIERQVHEFWGEEDPAKITGEPFINEFADGTGWKLMAKVPLL